MKGFFWIAYTGNAFGGDINYGNKTFAGIYFIDATLSGNGFVM